MRVVRCDGLTFLDISNRHVSPKSGNVPPVMVPMCWRVLLHLTSKWNKNNQLAQDPLAEFCFDVKKKKNSLESQKIHFRSKLKSSSYVYWKYWQKLSVISTQELPLTTFFLCFVFNGRSLLNPTFPFSSPFVPMDTIMNSRLRSVLCFVLLPWWCQTHLWYWGLTAQGRVLSPPRF